MKPAPIAARAVAVFIDGAIVVFVLGTLIGLGTGHAHRSGGLLSFRLHGDPAWLWYAGSFAYWIVLERVWGTTPGKRLFGYGSRATTAGRSPGGSRSAGT